MSAELMAAIEGSAGSRVTASETVSGGDINEAHRVALSDGRTLFVKSRSGAPADTYRAEADGLSWLGAAGAPVPDVVGVGDGDEPRFLALSWIERGSRDTAADERLGRDLASLHRSGADRFGLAFDNYVGSLRQANGAMETWSEFYGQRRLLPLTGRAFDARRVSRRVAAGMDALMGRMDDLAGPPEPPARLHGDLWSGNALTGSDGVTYLIDPAVYGGHREVDLAMMRLFGGFSAATFDAYGEMHPLADGHVDRVALYQLYPLLAHAVMFGGVYGARVESALAHYVDV